MSWWPSPSATPCRAGPRSWPVCCSWAGCSCSASACWANTWAGSTRRRKGVRPTSSGTTVPRTIQPYGWLTRSAPLARRGGLFLRRLPVRVVLGRGGHRPHPLPQSRALVGELTDVVLGVRVLRAPVERVERADLDADAAVHAQREVDGEPVEHVALPRPATGDDDLRPVPVDVR